MIVIGAGFGGLAIAIRLAARGHEVTLIEKQDQAGGRAAVFEQDGFTFDAGPTVITAPWLINELFDLAGKKPADYVDLVPVDPFYRIFFSDGTSLDYNSDSEAMERQIFELTGSSEEIAGYRRFLRLTEDIFAKGFTDLADSPFLTTIDMGKIAPDLIKLQSYRTVYGLVAKHVQDDRLRQAFSFHPLLVGGNPFQTTSIYTLIHHLERKWGIWFAMGGTGAIVAAMVRVFQELGGRLQLNAEVGQLLLDGRRAFGVRLTDGREFRADAVVCNADIATVYMSWMPGLQRKRLPDWRLRRMRHSMSLFVHYFGTDRTYRDDGPSIAHHNIILGPRYKGLLDDIFVKKRLADDFSLYLHMPTLTDPSLAPPDCEAFYVLSPVPHLGSGIDWSIKAKPYRDRIVHHLEEHYLPNLSSHIVSERMIDPRYFRHELNSYLGAAFSFEPVLTQSAGFRPHNRSEEVDALYFVGAGTHPGAGMPGVLSSARIADDLILQDGYAPTR
jgi:phytoene desaturase